MVRQAHHALSSSSLDAARDDDEFIEWSKGGFEPGVEALQTGSAIAKLLSRLAFWSALICGFTRVSAGSVPKLFPSPLFP